MNIEQKIFFLQLINSSYNMINKYPLTKDGITAFCWNKDRRYICIAPNNSNEALIYDTGNSFDVSTWKLAYVLEDHTQPIAGLDWCDVTNMIISCGHDKNAMVYTFTEGHWKPELIIMPNQDRAALCVCWNKNGGLFALGSGNKRIFLGYFEKSNNWWTCVHYKVHNSSVTAVSFHPSKMMLASASTDKKVKITSTYIADFMEASPGFPSYGTVLYEVDCIGWVNDVAWSPSGIYCAAVSHDSMVHIINSKEATITHKSVQYNGNAFLTACFTSDSSLYCCGYSRIPVLFGCI